MFTGYVRKLIYHPRIFLAFANHPEEIPPEVMTEVTTTSHGGHEEKRRRIPEAPAPRYRKAVGTCEPIYHSQDFTGSRQTWPISTSGPAISLLTHLIITSQPTTANFHAQGGPVLLLQEYSNGP